MKVLDTKRFISFEGIDFSGKSTQIELLKQYLEEKKFRVFFVREPGGTAISEKIRQILLDRHNSNLNARTEILLYSAARAQLVAEKIIPLLETGYFVIADRFVDSTTAYQGYGRQIGLEIVENINRAATFGMVPGITFYLELTAEESLRRLKESGRAADRLETAGIEFFKRVLEGYQRIAETNQDRYCIINAIQPIETIHQQIIKEVSTRMGF